MKSTTYQLKINEQTNSIFFKVELLSSGIISKQYLLTLDQIKQKQRELKDCELIIAENVQKVLGVMDPTWKFINKK